jgi:hypothetical protein
MKKIGTIVILAGGIMLAHYSRSEVPRSRRNYGFFNMVKISDK